MKISSIKFLIFLNLMGNLMIFSSSSWLSIWMGMEISSMTAPALITSMNSSLVSKINSWKYYMIQCYSSTIFFLCMLTLSFSSSFSSLSNFIWIVIIFSMLLKMGIFPYHGWFFHLAFSLPWSFFLFISTIQKIGPLLIISECSKALSQFFQPDLFISLIISIMCISGLMINSIRYFMVTSSIINSSWMLVSTQVGKFPFLMFMIIYFFHLLILFSFLSNEFSNPFESSFFPSKKPFLMELMKIMIILSMIGMPPMVGFFMKMSIIEQLLFFNQIFSSLILLMSSSMVMLMYMKMVMSTMMNMRVESWKQLKPNSLFSFSILFLLMSLLYLTM